MTLWGCSNNASNDNKVKTETASDTITRVTNPGVGAASDDTGMKK